MDWRHSRLSLRERKGLAARETVLRIFGSRRSFRGAKGDYGERKVTIRARL